MVSTIRDMCLMLTNPWEYFKSLVLGACIIVSWKIERGSYILPSSSVFFALTQFLRWPKSLKDFLSEVRIVCGPACALSVFATWLKQSESYWVLRLAVLCSSVAAIVFRPDNTEVLALFPLQVPSSRNRKVCHAIMMTCSLLCITVHILLYQTFPCTAFKPVCIVVVILCVCFFLLVTDTASIIFYVLHQTFACTLCSCLFPSATKAAFTRQTKVGKLVLETDFKKLTNSFLHTSNSCQITNTVIPTFCQVSRK